ncbi:MAG TPA: phenylalanine--tRNA ligase subunit beta [Fimbriimonadaceae bacterium]|nr:phenylalanine--tRNA ligase subunit beta [Fimbriimonadaceae bacterium]
MKFPYAMLRNFVETSLDAVQIGDLLTMAGFELEGIEEIEGDSVLDIKVVSNRGDGLSVFGLAREVLAKDAGANPTELYRRAVQRFPTNDGGAGELGNLTSVEIETTDCTRYACRMFRAGAGEAPDWIQKRLRQAGMRPISPFVDLTNYVMLELGQPLHAFDFDTLRGKRIVVRKAREGEKLTTLNEVEHELRPDQMMICDAERPVAAAGVMGGLETEVTAGTGTVLLESAHFLNTSVRRTRKQLGLSTEASYRFERSVDPEGVVAALNRFKELIEGVVGPASSIPGLIDVYPHPPEAKQISVRMERVRRLLGVDVTAEEARNYLERLGFSVQPGEDESFTIAAPTWRPDIVREDDVVEEIGRVHGYEKIPEVLPHGATPQGGVFGLPAFVDTARETVVRAGFIQTWSHSLRDAHALDATGERVGPRNPGSPDMALLRNSILPSVADAVRRNGARDLHLFEIGRVFAAQPDSERIQMALLSMGSLQAEHWVKSSPATADFFSMKGVVESLLGSLGVNAQFAASEDSRFHPTKQAAIRAGGEHIGVLGELHPDVAEELGFPQRTIGAEIELEPAFRASDSRHRYLGVSRNPAVRRDMAVLVDKSVTYDHIANTLKEACGEVLEKQWLFDVYEGQGIPEGKHSLAIALQLRKQGENFTDEEANQVREKAAKALERLGATLR